jgi:dihydroorotase-like cyclic amidohydrolase
VAPGSQSKSLIIKGNVYTGGKVQPASVRVERGVITDVSSGDLGPADQAIQLSPHEVLLPGAVDLLCGMRDWIAAPKERVETATKGALAGGVTVVCDQANIVPRLNVVPRIRERAQFVAERAYCDFGVAGAPPLDLNDIDHYAEAGAYCVGLYSWNLRIWRYVRDLDDSQAIFKRYAQAGVPTSIVPDEAAFQQTPLAEVGEAYALEALLRRLDPALRVRIQVSQPANVDMILAARDRLPNVLIQTPHHSVSIHKEKAFENIGIAARHVPPLRTAEEVERMKQYAAEGKIDIFTSWHAPHRTQDKYGTDPIPGEFTPKAGYSAIDIAYVHFLSRQGIETTCRCYCENPARAVGLKKGVIAKGYEADLVIFEQDQGAVEQNVAVAGGFTQGVWKVEPNDFYSMGRVTPFAGERLRFRTKKTFLRGQEVFDRATGTHTRVDVKRVECVRY